MKYFKFLSNSKIVIFILISVTFLSYINILNNDFAYDDEDFFINWEAIRDVYNIPQMLGGDLPASHQGVYRPLRSVFYTLSYKLWGENPAGYHFQAILIHLIVVLLVYKITMLISKNKFIALGSGIIFATHPIHTEAITYATASMDTIGIVFFFASFYFYLKSRNFKDRQKRYLIFALISAFLAFFIYEMTLTLPFLIVAYDFAFKGINRERIISKVKSYIPFFAMALFYFFIRIFIAQIGNRADYLGENVLIASRQARIETMGIISHYIYLLIFPSNLTIIQQLPRDLLNNLIDFIQSIDKSGQLIGFLAKIDFLVPIVILTIILGLSSYFWKKSPVILFSLLWFFISLLPILSIIPQGAVIAERYLYIPSFGFSLMATYFFYKIYLNTKKYPFFKLSIGVMACFAIINALYMIKTVTRNQDWKDPITLWTSAVKANTDNSLTYGALGHAYYQIGNQQKALESLEKSLEYKKSNENVYFYLGKISEDRGDFEKAISFYQQSIKVNPYYVQSYNRLGIIYFNQNQLDMAVEAQKQAIQYAPKVADFNYNLAVSLEGKGNLKGALNYYKKAIELNPNHTLALNNASIILSNLNEDDLAIKLLNQAIESDPNNANPHFNLAVIYEKKNNITLAIESYKRGLKLNPDQHIALEKLNTLLQK